MKKTLATLFLVFSLAATYDFFRGQFFLPQNNTYGLIGIGVIVIVLAVIFAASAKKNHYH